MDRIEKKFDVEFCFKWAEHVEETARQVGGPAFTLIRAVIQIKPLILFMDEMGETCVVSSVASEQEV